MSAEAFRSKRDDESVPDYLAARSAHDLQQLYCRVAKLEEDRDHLAAVNVKLLNQLCEMWLRLADDDDARGNNYSASQWRYHAGSLMQLMLDH